MTPPVFLLIYAGLLTAVVQHPNESLAVLVGLLLAKLFRTL